MSEGGGNGGGNGNGRVMLPRGMNLQTIIILLTVGGSFIGQWYVSNENAQDQSAAIEKINDRLDQVAKDLATLERDAAVKTYQIKNIDDVLTELRRQARVGPSRNFGSFPTPPDHSDRPDRQ